MSWEHDGQAATGFDVRRETSEDAEALVTRQVESFEVGADARQYVDSAVEPGVTYRYTVAARGEGGTSSPAAPPPGADQASFDAGVDMLVGTNDRRWDDGVGTMFVVYYGFAEDVVNDPAVTYEARIDGPPGWNDGRPVEWTRDVDAPERGRGWSFINESSMDAMDGDFTLTVTLEGTVGPRTYTRTVTFDDADFYLGGPTDITSYDVGPTSVSAEWTPPPGTMSTVVTLYREGEEDELLVREGTFDTRHTFEGLELEDGLYAIEVAPFNFDVLGFPVPNEPLGLSYRRADFTLGDTISPLCDATTDVVEVPDAAVEAAVRDEVDVAEGDLTCADLARLHELDVEDAGATSLVGLEFAENLEWLQLNGNDVADLTPVLGLDGLTGLGLDENPIPDLAVLDVFTQLRYLSIGRTEASDLSFASGMTELERLYAWDDQITDLGPLSGTSNLRTLALDGNSVSDLAPISGNVDLEELFLSDNSVDDLAALSGFTGLLEVTFSGNPLGDAEIWPIVEAQDGLVVFEAAETGVGDASSLADQPGLTYVDLRDTAVSNVDFVSSLNQLELLLLDRTGLVDPGPIANATTLVEIGLNDVGLTDVGFVAGLTMLEELDLSDNEISDLGPLVDNAGIDAGDRVYLGGNPLDTDDPQVAGDIQTLLDRGVDLDY